MEKRKKLTTEEFIKRSKAIHGDKYNYSKTRYVKFDLKVTIISEHGEFRMRPSHHLAGQGCPVMSRARNGQLRSSTTEEFTAKAKDRHGAEKYDYSDVKYINAHSKVTIHCKKHGAFQQSPNNHLTGRGCHECGKEKNVHRLTKDVFVSRARKVHGDKYDYSKVVYKNNKTAVTIICPIIGEFEQAPVNHLKGAGSNAVKVMEKKNAS